MHYNQSYFQCIQSSQILTQKIYELQHQVRKLTQNNQKLQKQNSQLKNKFSSKENQLSICKQQVKQLSKTLIKLSKGILFKQERIAQKNKGVQSLKDSYQNQINQLKSQKEKIQKWLTKIQAKYIQKREENMKLRQQSKLQEKIQRVKSGQIIINHKLSYQKKLAEYKSQIKQESYKNAMLEMKIMEMEAQLKVFKQQQKEKSKKYVRSETFGI